MQKTASQIADHVLSKCAIDLASARKAYRAVVKPHLLRASAKLEPLFGASIGVTRRGGGTPTTVFRPDQGIPSRKVLAQGDILRKAPEFFKSQVLPREQLPKTLKQLSNLSMSAPELYGSLERRTRSLDKLRELARTMSPAEREMTNRMIGLHEASERAFAIRAKDIKQYVDKATKAPQKLQEFRLGTTHIDPRVLMSESNMIASLPPELARSEEFIKHLRSLSSMNERKMLGSWSQAVPGFRYGQTKLTPAMRKQIMRRFYS